MNNEVFETKNITDTIDIFEMFILPIVPIGYGQTGESGTIVD